MISEYASWFFDGGWIWITALGFYLGWTIGFRGYLFIVPIVFAAIIGR